MKKLVVAVAGAVILGTAGAAGAGSSEYTMLGHAVVTGDGSLLMSARAIPSGFSYSIPTESREQMREIAAAAEASSPITVVGSATVNADGSVVLDSSKSAAGISFVLPHYLSIGEVTDFFTDYTLTSGCANGLPNFVISTVRGPMIMSLGSAAAFSCAAGVRSSSSLLRFGTAADTGQILAGTFTDTWGHAKSEYDRMQVTGISVVTTGPNQQITLSNFQLILNTRPESPSM